MTFCVTFTIVYQRCLKIYLVCGALLQILSPNTTLLAKGSLLSDSPYCMCTPFFNRFYYDTFAYPPATMICLLRKHIKKCKFRLNLHTSQYHIRGDIDASTK